MRENNSELWNFVSRAAGLIFFSLHTFFVWNLFSGQDEVQTSNLLHLSVGLSALRSHAPTAQPSRQLKTWQLLITEDLKLIILFFLFNNLSHGVCKHSAVVY